MAPRPLWTPSPDRVEASNMTAFARRAGRSAMPYEDLHRWSVEAPAEFWSVVWDYAGIIASSPAATVLDDPRRMPGACWFEGARLNFAENLLRYRDDRTAIIFRNEAMTESRRISYAELATEVARTAAGLRDAGVEPGDRVVGFMPNIPETVIAMLAAASLGAIWSSCSPDFGIKGVLDRFARIEPKVLFAAEGYAYGGKRFSSLEKVAGIVEQLSSKPRVVIVPHLDPDPDLSPLPDAIAWNDFRPADAGEPVFEQLPFDHPLYIMYSSGTTGLPKCIVQSGGGVLLNQLKEHLLHVDMTRDDAIFYFTTCGWMMWNWLVAALGTGATVVLFDGSPFAPDTVSLWRLAAQEGVSVFGTSASYLAALEKGGVQPAKHFDLSRLRMMLSTGSPLSDASYDFVYRHIGSDLALCSISGGTDLNGCFVAGCPVLPVYRGEIQCRCLGMDVHAWDDEGNDIVGEPGELVCAKAFPSMPLRFWGDDDGSAYRAAYFERFPGVWTHGDFMTVVPETGGLRITGRSDATLNPGGVRIGTAEIYRVVEPMAAIADSLVIGQRWGEDVRVVLFVKLAEGRALDDQLKKSIKTAIKSDCSPRHVPARIVAVPDIPYTLSGKKVELAVRKIVHGEPVANRDALRNPESLDGFTDLPELAR